MTFKSSLKQGLGDVAQLVECCLETDSKLDSNVLCRAGMVVNICDVSTQR